MTDSSVVPRMTEHAVAVHLQFPFVRLDQQPEGIPVAGPGRVKQLRGHPGIIPLRCPADICSVMTPT